MKFVHRTNYCNKCTKKAFYPQLVNKKTIEQNKKCPRCGTNVVSFWEELNNKYILPYFVGMPFFAMSAIYGFWTSTLNQIRPVDIFVIIFNIIMTAVFTVYGLRYRKLEVIPQTNDNSLEMLKSFRKQTLYAFLYTLCGFAIAIILDILIVLIWLGIAKIT